MGILHTNVRLTDNLPGLPGLTINIPDEPISTWIEDILKVVVGATETINAKIQLSIVQGVLKVIATITDALPGFPPSFTFDLGSQPLSGIGGQIITHLVGDGLFADAEVTFTLA